MADDEEEVLSGPVCSYLTYKSEGDRLYLLGEYEKAIRSYTHALQQEPKNKDCLVARSRCYLLLGNTTAALNDAEASQMGNKDFHKGLYRKAESLYAKGEFELALMFYHRGHKLRPDDHTFRLGIQKAREAIDNSVGSPSSVRLETKGDLSFFYRREEKAAPKTKSQLRRQKLNLKQQQQKKQEQMEPKTNKTVRVLLGELYRDKEYLEKLLLDKELMKTSTESGGTIQDLIMSGISFLDTRTEFWRQQKPIFAREREKRLKEQSWKSNRVQTEETVYVLKKMLAIDALFADGLAEECKQMATDLMNTLKGWTEREVPNKAEFLGHLHNTVGNALVELGNVEAALKSYEKDLRISRKLDNTEGISRALDNMGRIYARIGEFEKAAEVWLEKEPLAKSNLERTWLFHEIGRCYLELNNNEGARNYGLKSLASAEKAGDEEWKMNSNVLVAQAEFKLGNLQTAVTFFEKALGKANLLNDDAAQEAISNALQNVRKEIEMADKAKEEELEQQREKQRAGMLDASPVFIERIKTEKSERGLKHELDFEPDVAERIPLVKSEDNSDSQGSEADASCTEGSSSTDSVCGLYSSESGLVSDVSARGSQVLSDRKIPQPPDASYPEGQEAQQGSTVVDEISKTEEDLECEEHDMHALPYTPSNSRADGNWSAKRVDASLVHEERAENEGIFSEETKRQKSDTEASTGEATPEKDAAAEVTEKDEAGEEEREKGETTEEVGQGEAVEEETEKGAAAEEETGEGEAVEDTEGPKEE